MFKKSNYWKCTAVGVATCGTVLLPMISLYFKEREWILSKHLNIPWDRKSPFQDIRAGNEICQEFIGIDDNLSRIDVMMRRGSGDYTFILSQYKGTNWQAKTVIPFQNEAQNYDFMSFIFPVISEAREKIFRFCLRANANNSGSIGVFKSSEIISGHTLVQEGKREAGANMVYQTYSVNEALSIWEFVKVLSSRTSQYKPAIFKVPFLYVYWSVFYAYIVFFIYQSIKWVFKKS